MEWQDALENFKNYLKIERNLSVNTIDSYLFDVKKLINFLNENKIKQNPTELSSNILKEFIYNISKKIKSPTQARII